ncbi:hypothetical protein [Lentzea guizhouensis]|uniref:hypothetical protein n=1 Tax=Lentzea guizhouensis TaxID=1586287 RepID=UPI0012B6990B|nr:hypothetical protein [Lentzea guizhouensis]
MGRTNDVNTQNNNNTNQAADNCTNGHIATNGQCSIGWCAYNQWPATWPENTTR